MEPSEVLFEICNRPDDVGPRLVYADWLIERGDPRGELIGLQCAEGACEPHSPEGVARQSRIAELLRAHEETWTAPLRALPPLRRVGRLPFHRGFVESLCMRADDFMAFHKELRALTPLRSLALREVGTAQARALADSGLLGQLDSLEVRGAQSARLETVLEALFSWSGPLRLRSLSLVGSAGPEAARLLCAETRLATLEALSLDADAAADDCIGAGGATALAEAPALARLRKLTLRNQELLDTGAAALASASRWGELEELDVTGSEIGSAGASVLCSARFAPRLVRLVLAANSVGVDGVSALAGSGAFARLRSLDLSHGNRLGPRGLQALIDGGRLGELTELGLDHCGLGAEGARLLLHHRAFPGLLQLRLSDNALGDAGFGALARAEHWRELTLLDAAANGIGEMGAREWAGHAAWPGLSTLVLRGNRLGSRGARSLAAWPGLAGLLSLSLEGNWIGVEGIRAFVEQGRLSRLRRLEVAGNNFGSEILSLLIRQGPRLRELWVSNVDAAAVAAFAASEAAADLAYWRLDRGALTDEGAEAIARASGLARLDALELNDCAVGVDGALALTRRFGARVTVRNQGQDLLEGLPG